MADGRQVFLSTLSQVFELHLADVPGQVVLGRLRGAPATAGSPVVVLSADATPAQAKRLRDAGAEMYLTKPLDVQHLLDLVDRSLAGQTAAERER